jgi:UDP-N-acetylmuramate dehydrogenase
MLTPALMRELEALAPLQANEPLAPHTTFGIGGPADVFIVARSAAVLASLVQICRKHDAPLFVLGNGSNILVGDRGIRGVVIENRSRRLLATYDCGESVGVQVESGLSCAALARKLARAGIAGFEWAAGIPGTIGGACYTNAGAYGGQISDHLVSASIVDREGRMRDVPASELDLSYRRSALTGPLQGAVVLTATLQFGRGEPLDLLTYLAELEAKRKAAQPTSRNVGSMFKNTTKQPAWWYIEQAGMRGYRIGGVEVSRKHCNFFINRGSGRAADVMKLVALIRERVRERFGVELELEVVPVGEGFDD